MHCGESVMRFLLSPRRPPFSISSADKTVSGPRQQRNDFHSTCFFVVATTWTDATKLGATSLTPCYLGEDEHIAQASPPHSLATYSLYHARHIARPPLFESHLKVLWFKFANFHSAMKISWICLSNKKPLNMIVRLPWLRQTRLPRIMQEFKWNISFALTFRHKSQANRRVCAMYVSRLVLLCMWHWRNYEWKAAWSFNQRL